MREKFIACCSIGLPRNNYDSSCLVLSVLSVLIYPDILKSFRLSNYSYGSMLHLPHHDLCLLTQSFKISAPFKKSIGEKQVLKKIEK